MKIKSGFTLLEVLLSLFILVMSIAILSDLQIKSVFRVWQDREYLDRVFLIKEKFLNVFLDIPNAVKPIKSEVENPELNVVCAVLDIDKKSELRDFMDFMKTVQAIGEWKSSIQTKRSLSFVGFALNPEQKEQKVLPVPEIKTKVS